MAEIIGLKDSQKEFLGDCLGVALTKRGPGDPHVIINILIEDDGNWFFKGHIDFSAFWLSDFKEVLALAEKWMRGHCRQVGGGWEFKEHDL